MSGQPGALVLQLTRVLDAPPTRVFRVLIEPAEWATWWGPHGFSVPEIEVDPRVGRRYRLTMRPPDGEAFHVSGEFLDIDPPNRLAYTFRYDEPDPDDRETVVTLSLNAVDGGTEVRLVQGDFATEARLELHRGGWTDSFDKLRVACSPTTPGG